MEESENIQSPKELEQINTNLQQFKKSDFCKHDMYPENCETCKNKALIKEILPQAFIDQMGKGGFAKSVEEAREAGRKGGSSTSPAKSLGAQLKWLKKKGEINDEESQHLYSVIKNKELSYLDARKLIEAMKKNITDTTYVKNAGIIAKCMNEWNKQVHGQKIEVAGDIHKEIDNSLTINVEMWGFNGKEDQDKLRATSQTIDVSPEPKKV